MGFVSYFNNNKKGREDGVCRFDETNIKSNKIKKKKNRGIFFFETKEILFYKLKNTVINIKHQNKWIQYFKFEFIYVNEIMKKSGSKKNYFHFCSNLINND